MCKNRKLVYWGAGQVAHKCLERFAKVYPEFVIDSYSLETDINGIPIIRPDSVKNWSNWQVIITLADKKDVVEYLSSIGLVAGVDFEYYKVFYNILQLNAEESLERAENMVRCGNIHSGSTMIYAPFVGYRGSQSIFYFFKEYIRKHIEKDFICICPCDYLGMEELKEDIRIQYVPYSIPKENDETKDFWIQKLSDASAEEAEWIESLEHRKRSINSTVLILLRYIYYKNLLSILEPGEIIWWGGWSRDSYIIGRLADIMNIPIRFAEYGWLPKTIQFDPCGIAGQSFFCKKDKAIHQNAVENFDGICEAKSYFYAQFAEEKKLNNEMEEANKLKLLPPHKKSILLVGMGDAGMDMNPSDIYWTEYISEVVFGSMDAFFKIKEICKAHGWNLIFKPHPKELSNQQIVNIDEDESVILINNMSVKLLIEEVDVVVSITSAVDFEAILLGKPLVQLGKNSLNTSGSTYVVNDVTKIGDIIELAINCGLTDIMRKNFDMHMQLLLNTTLWNDTTDNNISYGRKTTEDIFSCYEEL